MKNTCPKKLLMSKLSKINDHRFLYLGKGQLFGEECFLTAQNKPALYTIRCKSAFGTVLVINELEFIRRLKNNEQTLNKIR